MLNSSESGESGASAESPVDFDMAWEMAHASKADRDDAANLRRKVEDLSDSKNPIRMIQRSLTKDKVSLADQEAGWKEHAIQKEVRQRRFYESLKGSDKVHELYSDSADRAEAAGFIEFANVIRSNDKASASELAAESKDNGYATIDLIEQIGSHMLDPERDETKVRLGFADAEEALSALGISKTMDECKQRFNEGRTVTAPVPETTITIEFARTSGIERVSGGYGRVERISAFVRSAPGS